MMATMLPPAELRNRGFRVLVDALGWTNAVRFMQQFETSSLNYTQERENYLPEWPVDEMVRRSLEAMEHHRANKTESVVAAS